MKVTLCLYVCICVCVCMHMCVRVCVLVHVLACFWVCPVRARRRLMVACAALSGEFSELRRAHELQVAGLRVAAAASGARGELERDVVPELCVALRACAYVRAFVCVRGLS